MDPGETFQLHSQVRELSILRVPCRKDLNHQHITEYGDSPMFADGAGASAKGECPLATLHPYPLALLLYLTKYLTRLAARHYYFPRHGSYSTCVAATA